MKQIVSVLLSILVCVSLYAQKDVTKFLGFPVDGSKSELISKLKTKGFKVNKVGDDNMLTGRFNGTDVHIFISTENGKVCRVTVCDENSVNETDIKIRFNKLCNQFANNGKYVSLEDYTISDDEDLSYEMTVHSKRYEAQFYQLPEGNAKEDIMGSILQSIQAKYNADEIENASDEIKSQIFIEVATEFIHSISHKPVWFMISEHYGKYYISMFYDNELNRPNGEDL